MPTQLTSLGGTLATTIATTLAIASLLGGCSTLPLDETAREVRVIYANPPLSDCRFIADIVGSEGHWYTFLFISNTDLTLAAINDLKNQTQALDGNTVAVVNNREFGSSVTLIGQAYRCDPPR